MNEAERINMAKAEINATINRVGMKYKLAPHIVELIMSSELADIRGQIAVMNTMQTGKIKDEEHEKEQTKMKKRDKND